MGVHTRPNRQCRPTPHVQLLTCPCMIVQVCWAFPLGLKWGCRTTHVLLVYRIGQSASSKLERLECYASFPTFGT